MKTVGIRLLVLMAVLLALVASASARRHHRPYKSASGQDGEDVVVDVGSPVILTPLLEAGQIAEAQNASRVAERMGGVDSYSAFLTVNKEYNSNLFFWFFPAEKGMDNAPVVLWLQGGPGSSSLLGLFAENGPFRLHNSRKKGRRHRLKRRKQAWTRVASMLYVDSPVGAGFSFTDNEDGFARSEEDVGRNLLRALEQFFQLFPQLRSNEFFIAGESYAGKYIPALGMAIHTAESELKINLKGMAIGNPLSDPETMLDYGAYMHQLGLLDDHGLALFKSKEEDIRQLIGDKKWGEAQAARDALVGVRNVTSLFKELTGFKFRFNYLHDTDYIQRGYVTYVQSPEVRAMLHVGNATFHNGTQVLKHLWTDVMQSVKPWVEQLLENYDMLFYNGQLDLADPYPMMVNFLKRLDWSGAKDYQDARRKLWVVDGDLAGYSKTAQGPGGRRLTEVLVRAAGHMVPTDQPRWALDLITRFTTHQPF